MQLCIKCRFSLTMLPLTPWTWKIVLFLNIQKCIQKCILNYWKPKKEKKKGTGSSFESCWDFVMKRTWSRQEQSQAFRPCFSFMKIIPTFNLMQNTEKQVEQGLLKPLALFIQMQVACVTNKRTCCNLRD